VGEPLVHLNLFVWVQFNDPVTVTRVGATIDGNEQGFTVNSSISYGDLAFLLPGDDMPAAGTAVALAVTGTNRAGTAFNTTLMATIPAPAGN